MYFHAGGVIFPVAFYFSFIYFLFYVPTKKKNIFFKNLSLKDTRIIPCYKLLFFYYAQDLSNKILWNRNALYSLTKISHDSLQKRLIAEV